MRGGWRNFLIMVLVKNNISQIYIKSHFIQTLINLLEIPIFIKEIYSFGNYVLAEFARVWEVTNVSYRSYISLSIKSRNGTIRWTRDRDDALNVKLYFSSIQYFYLLQYIHSAITKARTTETQRELQPCKDF